MSSTALRILSLMINKVDISISSPREKATAGKTLGFTSFPLQMKSLAIALHFPRIIADSKPNHERDMLTFLLAGLHSKL